MAWELKHIIAGLEVIERHINDHNYGVALEKARSMIVSLNEQGITATEKGQ